MLLTGGAKPLGLDHNPLDGKAGGLCRGAQPALLKFRLCFGHGFASPADQKGRDMVLLGMGAGGVGVYPFDPVRKPVLDQEIQGTVGNRWL